MKGYADKDFYDTEYLSGREPVISTGFDFYGVLASKTIDRHTFGRVKALEMVPDEVKMCCCELAEQYCRREAQKKEAGGKTSEKIGTYSVTFEAGSEERQIQEERETVVKWLSATGLCYRGVRHVYKC